jgi:hypothetical protein
MRYSAVRRCGELAAVVQWCSVAMAVVQCGNCWVAVSGRNCTSTRAPFTVMGPVTEKNIQPMDCSTHSLIPQTPNSTTIS